MYNSGCKMENEVNGLVEDFSGLHVSSIFDIIDKNKYVKECNKTKERNKRGKQKKETKTAL